MVSFEEKKQILRNTKDFLEKKYGVKSLAVFGSFARGEEKPDSDMDILVEFSRPVGFFAFLDLEQDLTDRLGVKVDLVTKKSLKPKIGKRILDSLVYIWS